MLSTQNGIPASRQIEATPGRSVTAVVGLAIVSAHTSAVSSRIALRTASRSVMSTNVAATPNLARMCWISP